MMQKAKKITYIEREIIPQIKPTLALVDWGSPTEWDLPAEVRESTMATTEPTEPIKEKKSAILHMPNIILAVAALFPGSLVAYGS